MFDIDNVCFLTVCLPSRVAICELGRHIKQSGEIKTRQDLVNKPEIPIQSCQMCLIVGLSFLDLL